MLFNKEQIVLTLQEKVNEKIEIIRQEMAESLFDALTEESFFAFDKKAEDIVGGPFKTKALALEYVKDMDAKNIVIMTEKAIEKLSVKEEVSEALGSETVFQLKDVDSVLAWFADANYLDQEFEFDPKTGVLTMNGKAVATKGQDGSYTVDVTSVGNVGIKTA